MDTLRTLDTMAGAIRGLGPVHTPTIEQLSKRKSKRRRPKVRGGDTKAADGGVSVKETSLNESRFVSQERAREIVTPSPLALSPNPVGLPPVASKRSSIVDTPKVPFPKPLSTQDLAAAKTYTDIPRTRVDSKPRQKAPSTVARKIPRIPPPPLTLAPPTTRNRKVVRQSRASSLTVPLSPALSTVSTIAAIIAKPKKPSEKELRRRRFLKLTRTLGEDIPPELLVNNLSGAQIRDSVVVNFSESNSKANRRSISFSVDENGPRLNTQFPLSTTFEVSDSPNVLRKLPSIRRRDPALTRGPSAPALSSPITPTDHPSPSAPYFEDHPFRIVIEDTGGPVSPTTRTQAPRDSVYSIRDDIPWMRASLALPISFDTPFIEYAGVANVMRDEKGALIRGVSPGLLDVGDPRGVYRREKRQGWSGEWNQPHIQDVIEKLRQL